MREGWNRLVLAAAALLLGSAARGEFIHPVNRDDPLIYGVKGGIVVAVSPFALDAREQGGPRGLLRVGYEEGGRYHLINYIAVEPLVGDVHGYSELEQGGDGRQGKRFWIGDSVQDARVGQSGSVAGRIQDTADGRVLSFFLAVEPFANGAEPVIEVALCERHPDRVRLRTYARAASRPMRRCTLTATMGNQSRCRLLWLRGGTVFAPTLYRGYAGAGFVERQPFGSEELLHTKSGDVVAVISPDEFEPREVWPLPSEAWRHDGRWMAQFWLKRSGCYDSSLQCRVNGRRVYWGGEVPIPGGAAFENFELREDFRDGQEVWFGYTTVSPTEAFGFGYDASPPAAPRRRAPTSEARAAREAAKSGRLLTNGDFRAGLEGWQREGGAGAFRVFDNGSGKALSTFGQGGDADTGRLYQCFRVTDDATELRFALHGGADRESTYVALWDGDRLFRKMTGRNDNVPFRVRWDVTELRGRVVTLEIVDRSAGAWGFIGAQAFTLAGAE